jgi:hypothetical protein
VRLATAYDSTAKMPLAARSSVATLIPNNVSNRWRARIQSQRCSEAARPAWRVRIHWQYRCAYRRNHRHGRRDRVFARHRVSVGGTARTE